MATTTPSRPANEQRAAAGTKLRKSEMSSPAATKSLHVGRDSRQQTCPKVMFTGVVADNAEKVELEILSVILSVSSRYCYH